MTFTEQVELAEAQARAQLATELAQDLALADRATELAAVTLNDISAIPGDPSAPHVIAIILGRLINDLRGCVLLVRAGYVMQALSLAAGMLELGNTAGFIGDSAMRAERWLDHDDPAKTYPNVKEAIRGTVTLLGATGCEHARIVEEEYGRYRQLCMVKHGNPMAMSKVGLEITDDTAHIVFGPYVSSAVIRAARSALLTAIRYTWVAAMVYAKHHTPAERQQEILTHLGHLGEEQRAAIQQHLHAVRSSPAPQREGSR